MRTELAELQQAVEALERGPVRAEAGEIRLGWGTGLERGALHEWVAVCSGITGGRAPGNMSVLVDVGRRALEGTEPGRLVVWIGFRPYPVAMAGHLLKQSVFVEVRDRAERVWAMDVCLRSPAVAAVVGDGYGLTMAESRRLQLAAGSGGATGLIMRSAREAGVVSAARTRWAVRPRVSPDDRPRWEVELVRWKGHSGGVRRWVVRQDDEAGIVSVDAGVCDRGIASSRAWADAG